MNLFGAYMKSECFKWFHLNTRLLQQQLLRELLPRNTMSGLSGCMHHLLRFHMGPSIGLDYVPSVSKSHRSSRGGKGWRDYLGQGLSPFNVKGQRVTISCFAGHMVSVTATQLCHCGMKSITGNIETNKCGCVPTKFSLQKQATGRTWPLGFCLSTSLLV